MSAARAERLYLALMEAGDSRELFRDFARAAHAGGGLIPFAALIGAIERRSVIASLAGICLVDSDPMVRAFGESLITFLRSPAKAKPVRVSVRAKQPDVLPAGNVAVPYVVVMEGGAQ